MFYTCLSVIQYTGGERSTWAGTPPWGGTPPGHSACWDTVNKRAAWIPLECILVFVFVSAVVVVLRIFLRYKAACFSKTNYYITSNVEVLLSFLFNWQPPTTHQAHQVKLSAIRSKVPTNLKNLLIQWSILFTITSSLNKQIATIDRPSHK